MGGTQSNVDGPTSIYRKALAKLGSIDHVFKQNICFTAKSQSSQSLSNL